MTTISRHRRNDTTGRFTTVASIATVIAAVGIALGGHSAVTASAAVEGSPSPVIDLFDRLGSGSSQPQTMPPRTYSTQILHVGGDLLRLPYGYSLGCYTIRNSASSKSLDLRGNPLPDYPPQTFTVSVDVSKAGCSTSPGVLALNYYSDSSRSKVTLYVDESKIACGPVSGGATCFAGRGVPIYISTAGH